MQSSLLTKGVSVLVGLALCLSLVPSAIHAEEPMTTSAQSEMAQEEVIAESSDTPLERYAKLRLAWVVYREVNGKSIYAITTENVKREIQTLDFFTKFNANFRIQLVREGRLAALQTGDPILSVDDLNPDMFRKRPWVCRLVKAAANPAVYLVCGKTKRVIVREGVFHRYGWEFRDVETVTQQELDGYQSDEALSEETVFEEEVTVDSTNKRMLRERMSKRLMLRGKTLVRNRLVKAVGDPKIYIITPDGKRRHIANMEAAQMFGLNLKETTEVSMDELEAYPEASPLGTSSSAAVLDQRVTE